MPHSDKKMISFFVTTACNLSCRYCYTNKYDFPKQKLSLEFAKLGIDDFFKNNDSKHIRFFGAGEPTIEFDLIKDIKNYAYKKAGEDVKVEIQTNGCFSREVRDWLSKNADIIWLLWDRPEEFQDFYRPFLGGKGASKFIENNAKYLIKKQ